MAVMRLQDKIVNIVQLVRAALVVVSAAAAYPAQAQRTDRAATAETAVPAADPFLEIATLRLWDAGAPGARGTGPGDTPTLTVFRPQTGTGNTTAVIVAPGGAYLGLAANLEGRQVADWFAARGVTAFILRYRLGSDYLYPVPLQDAQRAVRLVRSRAADFGVAPDRVGMMGFSAGGHLTAAAGTMPDSGAAGAADPVDRVSSRPDFMVLGYPWLNAMKPGQRVLSYCGVMRIPPDRCAAYDQYSPERHVTARTPPTFIYHTTDDGLVPVDASATFYRALVAAKVPAEMHLFAKGRHGSGLGLGDPALDLWPALLEAWMRGRGLLTPDSAVVAETQRVMAPPSPRAPGTPFTVDLAVRDLLAAPNARAVLVKHLGRAYVAALPDAAKPLSLRALSRRDPVHVSSAALAAVDGDLRRLAP